MGHWTDHAARTKSAACQWVRLASASSSDLRYALLAGEATEENLPGPSLRGPASAAPQGFHCVQGLRECLSATYSPKQDRLHPPAAAGGVGNGAGTTGNIPSFVGHVPSFVGYKGEGLQTGPAGLHGGTSVPPFVMHVLAADGWSGSVVAERDTRTAEERRRGR